MQHSIAVVKQKQCQAACQRQSDVSRQYMPDVTGGMGVVVARPCHGCNVTLKCQMMVQHNANNFPFLCHWQIDACDRQ